MHNMCQQFLSSRKKKGQALTMTSRAGGRGGRGVLLPHPTHFLHLRLCPRWGLYLEYSAQIAASLLLFLPNGILFEISPDLTQISPWPPHPGLFLLTGPSHMVYCLFSSFGLKLRNCRGFLFTAVSLASTQHLVHHKYLLGEYISILLSLIFLSNLRKNRQRPWPPWPSG